MFLILFSFVRRIGPDQFWNILLSLFLQLKNQKIETLPPKDFLDAYGKVTLDKCEGSPLVLNNKEPTPLGSRNSRLEALVPQGIIHQRALPAK